MDILKLVQRGVTPQSPFTCPAHCDHDSHDRWLRTAQTLISVARLISNEKQCQINDPSHVVCSFDVRCSMILVPEIRIQSVPRRSYTSNRSSSVQFTPKYQSLVLSVIDCSCPYPHGQYSPCYPAALYLCLLKPVIFAH